MPADVLHDSPHARIAEQHVVEKGNQRRALASRRHIRRTKIRNHRHSHSCRNDRRLTRLPGRRQLAPKKCLRLALMIERLPVAAHQIRFHAKPPLRRPSTASA